MRHIRNFLSVVGALTLLGAVTAWGVNRSGYVMIEGRVLNEDHTPVRNVAVYLDRGSNLIERYPSDSTGLFRLPLFPIEPHRATWLICAPGRVPVVGKKSLDQIGTGYYTYEPGAAVDSTWSFYRAMGWSGPIPRECPRSTSAIGWRYPASTGKEWGAYTTTEPDWQRYSGPPALPK